MDIKKAVKLSFVVITLLIAALTTINTIVVNQIKRNLSFNNQSHDLVSYQSNMAFLLKDSIKASNITELEVIELRFHQEEENFEQLKDTIISKHQTNLLNFFIQDIKSTHEIQSNLKLLYKNEKLLEKYFKQIFVLQKKKFSLLNQFQFDYPTEKRLRTQLELKIMEKNDVSLSRSISNIKYYSKEALFQHKNKKYLNKWLNEINNIQHLFQAETIKQYRQIVTILGAYILEIEEIKNKELLFEQEVSEIVSENQRINKQTIDTISSLSASYVQNNQTLMLLTALITVIFILIFAIKIYRHVGLSVDEIESKVQDGLREVNLLNQEIENTQKEVVFTMGAIGESRSKETGNHVKRVAEYSKLLARYYGLPEQEAEMIKQASPMHDIGKVAIPDAILNKPARFNDEEYEIMKTHAELGYTMLNNSERPLIKMAAIVAYEHHEKWNGQGYPQGKKGEDIHIYGRITALADVFDALGSERVYKKAWDDQAIFDLFKQERGEHFDPKLIDIFFDHLDEFLQIRNQFKDTF